MIALMILLYLVVQVIVYFCLGIGVTVFLGFSYLAITIVYQRCLWLIIVASSVLLTLLVRSYAPPMWFRLRLFVLTIPLRLTIAKYLILTKLIR